MAVPAGVRTLLNPADRGRKPWKEVVKRTDTPDFVHGGCPPRDRHSSGPGVAHPARCYLPAHSAEPRQRVPIWYCCAQRLPVSPGLNRLVSVALILTLGPPGRTRMACRWRGVTSCAVLCSPDVPPVRPFGPGHPPCGSCPALSGLHQRRPGPLHAAIIAADPNRLFPSFCLMNTSPPRTYP